MLSAPTFLARLNELRDGLKRVFTSELPAKLQAWRKQLDLIGNDYYLAHIYRTLHWYTAPTHVTVLGDLLGSQWIDDEEFERRGWRFWQRVFRHAQKVEDEIMGEPTTEVLGQDKVWSRRIMNIVGNHDVGYAGDMTVERLQRFEYEFGKVNWEITFRLPPLHLSNETVIRTVTELRVIVLNSMNLDTPAHSQELQSQTYDFINNVITRSKPVEDRTTGTIVLTHIPLHKKFGVCCDSPFFDFHKDGAGIKEQNHLSPHASKGIFEGILGMSGKADSPASGRGRNGIVLTGHDHEGCDVYHYLPVIADVEVGTREWNATRWSDSGDMVSKEGIPGVREITVRSMMGDFGGNAGLLSAWFDEDAKEWRFAYSSCSIGVQHIWWAIHVLVIVTLGFGAIVGVMNGLGRDPIALGQNKSKNREETKAIAEIANGIMKEPRVLHLPEKRLERDGIKRRR